LRFLIANPAGWEAAGKTAQKRIEQRHQWQKIARVDRVEKMLASIAAVASGPVKIKAQHLSRGRG
jgi:hypothetical protein